MRPYTFPPLELALETDWDRKLSQLAARSVSEPITLVSGVPGWLLLLFQRVLELTGKASIAEVWPQLELVVHGGVKFDPYRESFQNDPGLAGDPASGSLPVLRGIHRLRRSGDRAAAADVRSRAVLSSSSRSTSSARPSDAPLAGDGRKPG